MAQVTGDFFKQKKGKRILRIIKEIKYAVDNRISLKIPEFDKKFNRIVRFSDSSYEINEYLPSQVWHVVFLSDNYEYAVPVSFKL